MHSTQKLYYKPVAAAAAQRRGKHTQRASLALVADNLLFKCVVVSSYVRYAAVAYLSIPYSNA